MEQRTTKDMNEIMKETIKNAKKTGPGARPRIRLLRVLHHRVPERHTRSSLRVLSLLGVLLLSAALTGCGAEEPELILVENSGGRPPHLPRRSPEGRPPHLPRRSPRVRRMQPPLQLPPLRLRRRRDIHESPWRMPSGICRNGTISPSWMFVPLRSFEKVISPMPSTFPTRISEIQN